MQKENFKNQNTISWVSPEYQYQAKPFIWQIAYAVILGLLVFYGVYSKSVITAILFVVLGIAGWIFANRKPESVSYQLSETGITINQTLIPYKHIKSFWIVYNPPQVKTLNLETTAYINGLVSIELGNQDPIEIKNFLQNYLMEDLDREESITDVIARKVKF